MIPVVAALERAGFYVHHQRGSHVRLLHKTRTDSDAQQGYFAVAAEASDSQAGGLTEDEFLKVL